MTVMLVNKPDPMVCALGAGLCYNAKDPWKALMHAMENGHESVAEHTVFSFLIDDVSRVLLAQLTRHRVASFSVQSQRYCGADLKLVMPETIIQAGALEDVLRLAAHVNDVYARLLEKGVPAEDARYFTLQAGQTRLLMTMNIRELRHFFELRCCNRAQWEIRVMADEMLRICKKEVPELFEDAGPGCVRGKCPEGKKACGSPRSKEEWE